MCITQDLSSVLFMWTFSKFLVFSKGSSPKLNTSFRQAIKCVSYSVMSDSLQPQGLQPPSLLCPWNPPSKNTGVGSNSLLQGIFLTQGSNPCLLHCKSIFHCLSHQGSLDNCWARSNEYYTVSHSPFLPRLSRSFELILM